jgi:hypothetical protein
MASGKDFATFGWYCRRTIAYFVTAVTMHSDKDLWLLLFVNARREPVAFL